MRVVSVSGTMDSGKTTLIKALVSLLVRKGKTCAVIVNEKGSQIYDDDFLCQGQISVEHLQGGWLGCSLAASLVALKKRIKQSVNPDFLFLEPSEMIVTSELQDVLKMGLRDIQYSIGPFITLIDGPSFSFQWEERPKLLVGQIKDADRVAISRSDRIDAETVEKIHETLTITDHHLLLLSRKDSASINELAQLIVVMEKEKDKAL